jgi:hypothetical protein
MSGSRFRNNDLKTKTESRLVKAVKAFAACTRDKFC